MKTTNTETMIARTFASKTTHLVHRSGGFLILECSGRAVDGFGVRENEEVTCKRCAKNLAKLTLTAVVQ
jgi:hypothetical protein